ncbi:hypothetical protein D3C85_1149480 [compost metagenome]
MRLGHAENIVAFIQGRHLHAMEMQVGDLVHAVIQTDRHGPAGSGSNQWRIVIAVEYQGNVTLIPDIDLLLGRRQRGVGHAAGIVGELRILAQRLGGGLSRLLCRTTAQGNCRQARAKGKGADAESSGHDRDLRWLGGELAGVVRLCVAEGDQPSPRNIKRHVVFGIESFLRATFRV